MNRSHLEQGRIRQKYYRLQQLDNSMEESPEPHLSVENTLRKW